MGCARTSCGWMEAMRHRIRIATRMSNDACWADSDGYVADAPPRRLSRNQSCDGMALRSGTRDAGAKKERRSKIAHPYCDWPRVGHRVRGVRCCAYQHGTAA